MAQRQIGHRKSSLVLIARFPVVKWRSRSVAKSAQCQENKQVYWAKQQHVHQTYLVCPSALIETWTFQINWLIFRRKILHLASSWKWEFSELPRGLISRKLTNNSQAKWNNQNEGERTQIHLTSRTFSQLSILRFLFSYGILKRFSFSGTAKMPYDWFLG